MKTKGSSYPIEIHFKGERLGEQSVPIFELGETLLAIQRLVQRAYLIASDKNTQQRSIYHVPTREKLALQLVKQEKGSDIYVLDWFLRAAAAIPPEVAAKMLEMLFTAGMALVTQRLLDRHRKLKREASLLMDDYLVIANRVGSVGKIESIDIHIQGKEEVVTITKNTKEYISRVKEEVITRYDHEFKGTILTVNVASGQFVDAMPEGFSRRVKVTVINAQDFDEILNGSALNKKAVYKFKGFTQVKPGEDPIYFENFIADEVTLLKAGKKKRSVNPKKKPGRQTRSVPQKPTRRVKRKIAKQKEA